MSVTGRARIGPDVTEGRTLEGDLELDADVVIVGSGASGAVVAAELAEVGARVVVLEEGVNAAPELYSTWRPSETMRHLFRDGGLTFLAGLDGSPMVNMTMGRCIGGSSVLTGGVCFRIPGHIMKNWRESLGLSERTEAHMERIGISVRHFREPAK